MKDLALIGMTVRMLNGLPAKVAVRAPCGCTTSA